MKKTICMILTAVLLFLLSGTVLAADGVRLEALDSSAVHGRVITYVGAEAFVAIYPVPLEAEEQFDVRNAAITCEPEGVVRITAEKEEQNRFGGLNITGLKKGVATVTVTDPCGASCRFRVRVRAKILYDIQNFRNFLTYLPYNLFMAIVRIFYK